MSASSAQVLSPSAGWAVVIGIGVGFSVLMLGVSYILERYSTINFKDNEEFTSASRSVKSGLVAASIVSAWTWAATLLTSSTMAFEYGISGPFWYAAGACIQVLIFSVMASKMKLNAPFAHTYLEIIRARWGKLSGVVHTAFALAANVLVSSMLITGASATVNQLTGMPILAAIFLTPVAVAIYTFVGGLRATFLADYTHTVVLIALIFTFAFTVYTSSDKIGSPQRMYDLLSQAAPVAGNAGGSYLTMRSVGALQFGIINICGNFASVFSDQSYSQRAIASSPASATKGFIAGGIAWYAVPMLMASSLGLAARALYGNDPAMANLTPTEVTAGLAAPAAAAALLGKQGAAAMLVLLYLAVTSAASAQLIAVASVFTFDVYKPFIRPDASSKELAYVSHAGVAFWAIAMGVLGCIFHYIGIGMGWLYTFMGIIIAPAVFPIFACLVWSKANRMGALVGILAGFALGIVAWLVTAQTMFGELTIDTTGSNEPLLAGNLVSILVPTIITIVWSLVSPDDYTFEETRAINAPVKISLSETPGVATPPVRTSPGTPIESEKGNHKDDIGMASTYLAAAAEEQAGIQGDVFERVRQAGLDPEHLQRSAKHSVLIAIPLSLVLLILIPCMAIIPKKFSETGFAAWVGIWIAWLFVSTGIVVFWPVWESRKGLGLIFGGMFRDLVGRGKQ